MGERPMGVSLEFPGFSLLCFGQLSSTETIERWPRHKLLGKERLVGIYVEATKKSSL